MGESAEYIEQNLIRTYLMDTGGFWELVRHFEDNEGNELNIECKLGRNVLCSIVRCVAGEEAQCKTLTLEMGDGRRQDWRLAYEDKGKAELEYRLSPVGAIAEAKRVEPVQPLLDELARQTCRATRRCGGCLGSWGLL